MKLQAVIFDLFGTIVEGFAASSAGYQERLSAALAVPHDELARHWRELTDRRTLGEFQTVQESIEHVCSLIGATVSAEQVMQAVDIRLNLTRHALRPRSDAVPTFAALKAAGLKIGLLSNCSIEIPIVWPETELAEFFDAAVFSSRERIKKPAAAIYHLACQRLGVAPDACLYVADGENYELAAAKKIGMHAVLMETPSSGREVLREAREWRGNAIRSLSELPPLTRLLARTQ